MFDETKRILAKKYLNELLDKKDPEIYKDLAVAATAIGRQMMMDWLNSKRIAHCQECPSDQQLLRFPEGYFCKVHAKTQTTKLEVVS